MKFLGRKSFLILGVAGLVTSVFGFVEIYLFLNTVPTQEKLERIVEIPRGTPFRKVAKELQSKGVITHEIKFYFLSRFQRSVTKIKAGEYLLYTNMKPLEVLDTLVSGKTYLYRAMIPEGYNIYEISKTISSVLQIPESEFLSKVKELTLLKKFEIEGHSVEGYLFPDTYFFSKPIDAQGVIRTMVKRFKENYSQDLYFRGNQVGFTQSQVVILASMIEKETGLSEERRLISSVFHNRLNKGMKLQSDPTVIYGLMPNFLGNLTKKDLLKPTPYNTYTRYGLPLGPIANPGKASLEAAVNPVPSSYLYFVSRNDGSHIFSTNYKDHLKAVKQYQPAVSKKVP